MVDFFDENDKRPSSELMREAYQELMEMRRRKRMADFRVERELHDDTIDFGWPNHQESNGY